MEGRGQQAALKSGGSNGEPAPITVGRYPEIKGDDKSMVYNPVRKIYYFIRGSLRKKMKSY